MSFQPTVHGPFRGYGKSLLVLPREEACRRVIKEPHIVISIRDPEWEPAKLPANELRRQTLWLAFHDVQLPTHGMQHMSEEDGLKIVQTVLKHREVSLVVVNCNAGFSRSPGVAAGLSVWLNEDDRFFSRHYRPNAWCKLMVLKAVNQVFRAR